MDGNPLLLIFMVIAAVFTVAIIILAVLQRRLLADQSRAVREMLEEARDLAQRGELSFDEHDDDDESEPPRPAD